MINKNIHIGIEFPESIPHFVSETEIEDLKSIGLDVEVRLKPNPRPMNTLDWLIPTAVAAYILKPYFEGFLNEAGKDHYSILKKWIKNIVRKASQIKVQTIYSSMYVDKKSKNNSQSKSVSLFLQTKNGKVIKLLFDNDLSKDDWDNAIDQLLDFTIENFKKYPNDILSKNIAHLGTDNYEILAIIDKKTKKLIFYDRRDLIRLHKQNIDNANK